MSDLSKQLLEMAQIAEAHFVKTFGTDRIAAVREAVQLLTEAREALEPFAKAITTAEKQWPSPGDLTERSAVCRDEVTIYEFAKARAVLAKLKAGSGDG